VEVDRDVLENAKREFGRIEAQQREEGFEVIWFIVDGFVLYWDPVRLVFSMSGKIKRNGD
jgi:nicotinamide/nicotinate riboside kinase